jgi:hypothetical protein
MDEIGLLCVPLGCSTFKLHDSPGTDAHAYDHKLDSVVKMATALQAYVYYRRATDASYQTGQN